MTGTVDPRPHLVAQTILKLQDSARSELSAYWLRVGGDRDLYASALAMILGSRGIPVLIVRQGGFDNPNALMGDVARLLEQNRGTVLDAIGDDKAVRHGVGMVLLARSELRMGQSSSPVVWPDWMPAVAGKQVTCFITDVSRRIDAPMDAAEVDVPALQRSLYSVEVCLLRRLKEVERTSPDRSVALFRCIRRSRDVSWMDVLAGATSAQRAVTSVESFRPSARQGLAIVSRLWEVAQSGTKEEVSALVAGLATALRLDGRSEVYGTRTSLFYSLLRAPVASTPEGLFSRNLLATVGAASQYITCAAHADQQQQYPIQLLQSVVNDLEQTLSAIEFTLVHLSEGGSQSHPEWVRENP